MLSRNWYSFALEKVPRATRDWINNLPALAVFKHETGRCAVICGELSNIIRFLWPDSPTAKSLAEIALIGAETGLVNINFAGHCGIPFERGIDGRSWANAKVIGLPPNDGCRKTLLLC